MKKTIMAIALLLCAACSSDSDNEENSVQTATATVEYLTSVQQWSNSSVSYMFFRLGDNLTGAKRVGSSDAQQYTYTLNAPSLVLTYSDGKTEQLTVYRVVTQNNPKQLQINGTLFVGVGNGIDM